MAAILHYRRTHLKTAISDIHVLFAKDRDAVQIVEKIDQSISAFIGKRVAEKEQEIEVKKRIESNAAIYIDEALKSLKTLETRNRRKEMGISGTGSVMSHLLVE